MKPAPALVSTCSRPNKQALDRQHVDDVASYSVLSCCWPGLVASAKHNVDSTHNKALPFSTRAFHGISKTLTVTN